MNAGERELTVTGIDTAERLLIEEAQKDPSRFADLYEKNFARVYAFIARRVADRAEAEDLTSEVFHQAFANLGKFEWRGAPFASWLFRIARNAIIDRARRVARDAEIQPILDVPTETGLDEIEHRAQIFRLVDELPADQRRVIEMRFAQEKSIREIAQALGRTEGAVKQLQFRALQNLRARAGDTNG
jgi:RNA polymerase sigma-70 factor (ECF subfamily)